MRQPTPYWDVPIAPAELPVPRAGLDGAPPQPARAAGATVAIQCRARLLREALASRLSREADLSVVGVVATGPELIRLCELRRPGLVVLEADRADWNVVDLVGQLRAMYRPRVIGIHEHLEPDATVRLGQAGIDLFIGWSCGLRALVDAARQLLCAPGEPGAEPGPANRGVRLTDRELAVLRLIGAGESLPDIAAALNITVRTVENYRRRIYAKLDVHSQAQALADAGRLGMLADHRPTDQAVEPVAWPVDRERRPLGLVAGQRGTVRDLVATVLLHHEMPVVIERADGAVCERHPARRHQGVVVAVLVDPTERGWEMSALVGARVVLVSSTGTEPASTTDAVLRGAAAVLSASEVAARLYSVFCLVSAGYLVVDAAGGDRLRAATRSWCSTGHALDFAGLTRRERDVLVRISRGDSVRQTARALGVAVKTVESVQSRLFRKLGVRNRSGALTKAYELGLIMDSDADPGPAVSGSSISGR